MAVPTLEAPKTAQRRAPILATAAVVVYPLGIYLASRSHDAWSTSLAAACAGAMAIAGLRFSAPASSRAAKALTACALALVLAGLFVGRTGPALAVPVVINALLFSTFALSLARGPTVVERLARVSTPVLDEAQLRYCRSVTIAWCVFFVLNGATAALLAALAPLAWWAAFTGAISYALVGIMFAAEYSIRSVRFPHSMGPLGIRIAALAARIRRSEA